MIDARRHRCRPAGPKPPGRPPRARLSPVFHRLLPIACCLWAAAAPALIAAPTIGNFIPQLGEPGNLVTVTGTGFSSAVRVLFNYEEADFVVESPTRLVAVVPPDGTTGPLWVDDGNAMGSSVARFQVAPRLTGFRPFRSGTNTTITLEGFNLAEVTNVLFGVHRAAFRANAPTQIDATVPAAVTNGPALLTVQAPAGTATAPEPFIVIGPGPIIDSFSPPAGAPGASVSIEGVNFVPPITALKFGNAFASQFFPTTDDHINAIVPANAQSGKISVSTSAGTATSSQDFLVTQKPVITNFYPAYGKADSTMVTLEGINFTNVSRVYFGSLSVVSIETTPLNQLVVRVPAAASPGFLPITVSNRFGAGVSAASFLVTLAPIITNFFNPVDGSTVGRPGDSVDIVGFNFGDASTVVRFNGMQANFTRPIQTPETLRAVVPSGATTGPLSVSNRYGGFLTSSNFTVYGGAPFVTGFEPGAGPRGAPVRIQGRNFFPPVTVSFNGVIEINAYAATPSEITAQVPAEATTGPIVVRTANGTSTNVNRFYVPPRLHNIAPASAPSGDSVVLLGRNFTDTTEVTFNGVPAPFSEVASNRLDATVPPGATTGRIRIVTPGGTIVSTNDFAVLPRILQLSPPLGPAESAVTIRGSGFVGVTGVRFGSLQADYTVVSSTEIQTAVPWNARTGPVKVLVTTADGDAESPQDFIVTGSSDLLLRHTAVPGMAPPGTELTWALEVVNRGPATVSGVRLLDTLPRRFSLTSLELSQGTWTTNSGVATCELGVLPENTSATLTLVGHATTEAYLTNRATVTSIETDYNPNDNTTQSVVLALRETSRTLRLAAADQGRQVVLAWPVSAFPFQLQSAVALGATNPTVWRVVPSTPSIVGTNYILYQEVKTNAQFYRLSF